MLLKELSLNIHDALNQQVEMEAASSRYYLAVASRAEIQEYNGM